MELNLKHTVRIAAEFKMLADVQKDISKADKSKKVSVFLGGDCTDKQWREQIKHKFSDKFVFLDPYDSNWEAEDNIYDECEGLLVADEVVFYKGGELTDKEKGLLDGVDKKYKTFTSVTSLSKYLESLVN
jgi:hypothetical protein